GTTRCAQDRSRHRRTARADRRPPARSPCTTTARRRRRSRASRDGILIDLAGLRPLIAPSARRALYDPSRLIFFLVVETRGVRGETENLCGLWRDLRYRHVELRHGRPTESPSSQIARD